METATFLWKDRSPTENWDNGIMQEKSAVRTSSKTHLSFMDRFTLAYNAYEARKATHRLVAHSSEDCSVVKLVLAREAKKRSSGAEERQINEVEMVSLYHASLAAAGFTSPQSLSPILLLSQTTSPPPILRTIIDNQKHQSHNGGTSQANCSRQGSPARQSELDIELNDMSSREIEEPPPPEEEFEDTRTRRIREERSRSIFSLPLCGLAIFLAPINIVSGMTASHGDNWKLTFVGSFISWFLVGTAWLFLDLYGLQSSPFTKKCLWHLGGCAASLYFFMSILHITSENLPQWLPTIIDCGVGMSLGFQNIPAAARRRVGESITGVIGSIFGGTQVIIRRDRQTEAPLSSRTSRPDIEMGSMV